MMTMMTMMMEESLLRHDSRRHQQRNVDACACSRRQRA
jgi:hypothetical protein